MCRTCNMHRGDEIYAVQIFSHGTSKEEAARET
jgi:hypothetical protein